MTSLTVENINSQLVVDSRLVAFQLGIEDHITWYQNVVKKYQTEIEQSFGSLNTDSDVLTRGSRAGKVEAFAWLTEEQAIAVMTLTPNTQHIASGKLSLVKKFAEAKKKVSAANTTTSRTLSILQKVEPAKTKITSSTISNTQSYKTTANMPGLDYLLEQLEKSKPEGKRPRTFAAPDWLEQHDPNACDCYKFKMSFSVLLSSLYKSLRGKAPQQEGCRAIYTESDLPLVLLAYNTAKTTFTVEVHPSEVNKLSEAERAVIGKEMTLTELIRTISDKELQFQQVAQLGMKLKNAYKNKIIPFAKASGSRHRITESTLFFIKEALKDIAA